jgi:hypothetical protein
MEGQYMCVSTRERKGGIVRGEQGKNERNAYKIYNNNNKKGKPSGRFGL